MLFIDQTELVILLAVCTVSAACFIAALIFLVWAVRNHKRKQKPARDLVELVADCNAVKSEFAFGEEFTCDGLVVNAFYNLKPESEILTQFDVLTEEEFARLTEANAVNGLCVIKPNMAEAGRAIVIIRYKGKATYYAITVAEPTQEPVEEVPQEEPAQEEIVQEEPAQEEPQEEPAEPPVREEPAQEIIVRRREPIVIEEESYESVLRYDKSFMARYIQSSDEVKIWYTTIKNELLSYKKVRARISWKRESFFFGREIVARFGFRGKTLCMYFPLDPNEFADTKYKIEDVSDLGLYEDTPCMYRLKNERWVRYAIELFALVMERKGGIRIERIAEDYYLPYEGIVELIEKGLAKRIIKKKSDEPIFLQGSAAEVAATIIIPDEEPAEGQAPIDDVQSTDAGEAEEDEEQAEGMLFEEVSPTLAETPVEDPSEESPESAEEAVETIADEETSAEEQTPTDDEQSTDAGEAEEDVVPAEEQAEGMLFEEVPSTLAETPVEDPSEESPESAEEAVETIADGETPAEQPVEEEPLVEEPVEEPAPEEEEPVIEELSKSEIRDVETYEETEKDEDGIEVVGVMFRRRGRKVYWFDPAGKTWEKGEIALYKSPDNPPQEVIIVDNAKRSPSKLHLPLKPLYKATRRPQLPKKR